MNIANITYRGVVTSTFLFPCSLIAFASGWLCDRFGSKIVSLTCIIISIPVFIWIGVPNQNIQSIVSALAFGGVTIAGTSVSILLVATKVLQKILGGNGSAEKDNTEPSPHLTSVTVIVSIIGSISGIGYFIGFFLSKLNRSIGFFWLCFLLAMLFLTCIPVIVYYSRSKNRKSHSSFSQSTSKKSIINNTRPESFAESMYMSDSDDDDTTIGSVSVKSICSKTMERKSSVIVIP